MTFDAEASAPNEEEVVSYCARRVAPVDAPPIERGCVVVRGERIVAVGRAATVAQGRRVDFGAAIITPGLVNAHTHLEFSTLAAPLGMRGVSFPDWILQVLEYRRAPEFDAAAATLAGVRESIRRGVTTLGDIATCLPALLFEQSPPHCDVTSFVELIGLRESRAQAQIEYLAEFIASRNCGSRIRRGISPHAPYSVRPNLLEAAVRASAEHRLPLAFHLAETRDELRLLKSGEGPLVDYLRTLGVWDPDAVPRGARPLDYLRLLSRSHRALVVHGNYLADDELDYLAQHARRMTTVYCPRTHDYFRHGTHPLTKLITRGAAAALGTDGRCTNPDLDLFGEMLLVAELCPQLPPHRILQLGTLDGARALGLERKAGSLTPGKRANFLVFTDDSHEADPGVALLSHAAALAAVYYRGRKVPLA